MKFKDFTVRAYPKIEEVSSCECGTDLKQVSNGWYSYAWACPKCLNIYCLELRKYPSKKVNKDFLNQVKRELKLDE